MPKLLILGGGWSHIPSIKIANQMKLFTIVMDKNPKAPGFKFCNKKIILDGSNKKNVLRIAKNEKVNGILCTGDYSIVPAAYACSKLKLPMFNLKTANLVINKALLFKKFQSDGIHVPKSNIISNYEGALKFVKKSGFPIILKPEMSVGGGRGVIKANSLAELKHCYNYTVKNNFSSKIIIEEFLDGIEHTIESITIKGKTKVLAISDKIRTTNRYCVALSLDYPSRQPSHILQKLEKQAKNAIKSSGIINGVTHIEAISYKNNVYIIDFGARGGAGGYIPSVIIPRLTGVNMMESMINLAIGNQTFIAKPKVGKFVTYRFFNVKPGKIKRIVGIKKGKEIPGLIDLKIFVEKNDIVKTLSNQLLRPGYFVIEGKSLNQIKKRISAIEKIVRIET